MKTRIIGAVVALVLAALGAYALIGYVRGADARAAEGAELTDVYVVQQEIPRGTAGERVKDFVKTDSVPKRNVVEDPVTNLDELNGLVADASVLPGEQLSVARFVDPLALAESGDVPVPAGMQEVSFALPTQRVVGGGVQAGSTVGLVLTKNDLGSDAAATLGSRFEFDRVLVTRVEIGTTVSSESQPDDSGQTGDTVMVTVAVSTHDAERLVWALEGYEDNSVGIWLTLQNDETDTNGSSLVTDGDVRR